VSRLYPLYLDLRDANVLVVGGGAVATRKVAALVSSGGRPEVVAPDLTPELERMIDEQVVEWSAREYESADVGGRQLVIAATSSAEVNARVKRDARQAGAWVNVVDDPEASTFQVPAVIRAGDVTIALSTGGAAPLLARRLRERLEAAVVTPGLARAVDRLAEARGQIHARWPADEQRRRQFWFALITQEFLDSAIAGRDEEVESRIETCLSQS
jgi:siroheme synthase-like protein